MDDLARHFPYMGNFLQRFELTVTAEPSLKPTRVNTQSLLKDHFDTEKCVRLRKVQLPAATF